MWINDHEEELNKCPECRKYFEDEDFHFNTNMCLECRYEEDEE